MRTPDSLRRDRVLPALAKLPFGIYIMLGLLSLLLCTVGIILFMVTAAGRTYDAFRIAEDAVTIRGINGLAVDGGGNLYVGTSGSSSIQVFDAEGHFLYRLCVPTYKAVDGGFYWSLNGSDELIVYVFRPSYHRICWDIRRGEMTDTTPFDSRAAFEEAVQADGFQLNVNSPGAYVREGRVYRMVSGGSVRSWPDGHPEDAVVCQLEVPHWPPPIPVCWAMAALGFLGTAAFLGTAVKVEAYRAAHSVKNRRNG